MYTYYTFTIFLIPSCTASIRRPASSPDVEVRKNRRVLCPRFPRWGCDKDFLKIYGKSMNFDDCLGEIIMK